VFLKAVWAMTHVIPRLAHTSTVTELESIKTYDDDFGIDHWSSSLLYLSLKKTNDLLGFEDFLAWSYSSLKSD
jgi:hypothetical protein